MVFSALSYDFYVKTIWFMRLFHMVFLWCGVYLITGTDPLITTKTLHTSHRAIRGLESKNKTCICNDACGR